LSTGERFGLVLPVASDDPGISAHALHPRPGSVPSPRGAPALSLLEPWRAHACSTPPPRLLSTRARHRSPPPGGDAPRRGRPPDGANGRARRSRRSDPRAPGHRDRRTGPTPAPSEPPRGRPPPPPWRRGHTRRTPPPPPPRPVRRGRPRRRGPHTRQGSGRRRRSRRRSPPRPRNRRRPRGPGQHRDTRRPQDRRSPRTPPGPQAGADRPISLDPWRAWAPRNGRDRRTPLARGIRRDRRRCPGRPALWHRRTPRDPQAGRG
jgi:hypothetical protein